MKEVEDEEMALSVIGAITLKLSARGTLCAGP
jgi:hypothetical protein